LIVENIEATTPPKTYIGTQRGDSGKETPRKTVGLKEKSAFLSSLVKKKNYQKNILTGEQEGFTCEHWVFAGESTLLRRGGV